MREALSSQQSALSQEQEQREAVVAEALSWIGTPYHEAARVKGAGVDCAQLPFAVYRAVRLIPDFEIPYYPRDWHHNETGELYLGIVLRHATEIPRARVLSGDFAMFYFGKNYAHGAIVMPPGWPHIVHANMLAGGVIRDHGDGGRLADRKCQPRFFTLWPQLLSAQPEADSLELKAES